MTDISDEDRALFRDSVGDARPVTRKERVKPRGDAPAPEPRMSERSEREVMEELLSHDIEPEQADTGELLQYLRPGLQHRVLQRLKRGRFTVGDELDLHQMTVRDARWCLGEFLVEARERGVGCVRIVHGKGRRSRDGEGVLRRFVAGYLRRHPAVLAFTAARRQEGGSGAVIVLLGR
ncbi:MAG: Smr/MutS family protein [Pseudomonadota bacterium]